MGSFQIGNRNAALFAFAFFVIVNAASMFSIVEFPLIAPNRDKITTNLKRYEHVAPDLTDKDVIGYISDSDITKVVKGNNGAQTMIELEAYKRFTMAQYALAPNVLIYSGDRPMVLANFLKPGSTEHLGELGFVVVKDYGDGVLICKHE
jgi:hypothetical protein